MILTDKDALARVNSPLNLLNRMRGSSKAGRSMSLFTGGNNSASPIVGSSITIPADPPPFNPFHKPPALTQEAIEPEIVPESESETAPIIPAIDNLVSGADQQIKLAHAHDRALEVLTSAVEMMSTKLDDVHPSKLPSVISATSKVVESIRRERNEAAKARSGKEVHFHFYTPAQKQLTDYEIVEAG